MRNLIDIRNERLKSLENVKDGLAENHGQIVGKRGPSDKIRRTLSYSFGFKIGAEAGYNEGWGALLDLVRPVLEKSVEGRKLLERF